MNDKIKKLIMLDEGFKGRMYKDTLGIPTIGFGFNLESVELPFNVASEWMDHILTEIEYKLRKFVDCWDILDESRQYVIINMMYNLGNEGARKFNIFFKAIERQDFEDASNELKKSLWYAQLPERVERLRKIMLTGRYNDE